VTTKPKGTGLGLAIVKRSSMNTRARSGWRTCPDAAPASSITLPLQPKREDKLVSQILSSTDEIGIRELLSEILADEGHTVQLAENAAEARALRGASAPTWLLLDIWMPDATASPLLKEWAANGQLTMPVVMMSGQRHHRNGGRGHPHRCHRFSGKADCPAKTA